MRDGFAGGSAVRYMDTRPQLPETGEQHFALLKIRCIANIARACLLLHAPMQSTRCDALPQS
jgi:hypothetical protein